MLTMGVARFPYTPLLPLMQRQAGLGVAEAGWLAAIHYVGYLCGAVVASALSDSRLKDRMYRLGLVVAVASTAAMGLTTHFYAWAVARWFAGVGTAAGMLLGTGLVLSWLMRRGYRSELGIHFSGIGLGIAASAVGVELMSRWLDWQGQWLAFSALGCALLVPSLRWVPRPDRGPAAKRDGAMADQPPSALFLQLLMAAYFCAGVGYVVSTTFIVAIVDHLPGLAGQGSRVFLVIGLAAAPACAAWDFVARRTGYLNALILASVIEMAGIALPVTGRGLAAALAVAVLFGGTFVGGVSLVLTMAGRYYPTRPTKMMGRLTIAYGLAQILAPAVTGRLAVARGGYAFGLYFAAAVTGLGTALLAGLKVVSARGAPRLRGSLGAEAVE